MNYYIITWLIITIIISLWAMKAMPSKSILSKYPYFNLVLGVFSLAVLSRNIIDRSDLECLNKFIFRLRILFLYFIVSMVFFLLISTYSTNCQLIKMQELVEKAESQLEKNER